MADFTVPTRKFFQLSPSPSLRLQRCPSDEQNWALCSGCTQCCEYISLEIDRPASLQDVDNIIWYLIHHNVWVWVDHGGKWYVQFNTPCRKLELSGRCGWYGDRPKICQDYKQSECPRYSRTAAEKFLFTSADDFLNWLAAHRSKAKRELRRRYLAKRAVRWRKTKALRVS
jgi:Fe-S-cluster containining protein